jgi:hypothetical protein
MNIKYNTPIEVTRTQYNHIMTKLSGICAGQIKDDKYFIMVWLMEYSKLIKQIINQNYEKII